MAEQAKDRKELVLKCIESEQEVQDVKREVELKDVKIESLQNIIKKRGFNENSQVNSTVQSQ